MEILSADGIVIMTKSGGDYFGELALLTVGETITVGTLPRRTLIADF